MARAKAEIMAELEETRERLKSYLAQEKNMLSPDGVQGYTIGTRNLQRYQTGLGDIQKMIKDLRKRIRELEAELRGQSPRRAIGVTPRDW